MIPKKIHYCWFGHKPLPNSAKKCIRSWKKYFPDYEIIEWNEENYDVHKIPYIEQAYNAKKYAFVSDYARYDILYHEGGFYFDTDVEVIKSFEDIFQNGSFFGCEVDGKSDLKSSQINLKEAEYSSFSIRVNPGLGMASEKENPFYKEFLDLYNCIDFIKPDGSFNSVAVVRNTTNLLVKHGLRNIYGIQKVAGITIYPKAYFNPFDSATGRLVKEKETHSVHWYTMSWMNPLQRTKVIIMRILRKVIMR